jgi:hypothetical protein
MFIGTIGSTRTLSDGHGPLAVVKLVPVEGLLEMVMELIHPANLKALPPSPDFLVSKAIQIGLVSSFADACTEVCVWRRHHTKEQDQAMMFDLRQKFQCV